MSDKSNAFERDLLELVFTNVDLGGIGDSTGLRGSTTPGSFYIALADTDPGETSGDGGAASWECTPGEYGQYTRQAVARSTVQWSVSATAPHTCDNDNDIEWTEMSSGSGGFTVGYLAICKAGTIDTQDALYHGSTSSTLVINNGVIPTIAAGALDIVEE